LRSSEIGSDLSFTASSFTMLLLSSNFLRHAATAGEAHQKRRAEGLRAPWNGVPEVRLHLDP